MVEVEFTASWFGKLLLIGLRNGIIILLIIRGLIQNWKMPQRNYQVIALLCMYVVFLMVLTFLDLVVEWIPLIFIILVIACSSQVYQ